MNATDADEGSNSALIFSIISSSSDFVGLDLESGMLFLSKPLTTDLVQRKPYMLQIRVIDRGSPPLSSDAIVEVRVVANAVPVFPAPDYRVQIQETLEVGSPIISLQANYPTDGNASALDRKVVYAIVAGDPFYTFDIDFHTGSFVKHNLKE